jgi:hypothetical protein
MKSEHNRRCYNHDIVRITHDEENILEGNLTTHTDTAKVKEIVIFAHRRPNLIRRTLLVMYCT